MHRSFAIPTRSLLFITLAISAVWAHAQAGVGLKLVQFRPAGELGFAMKKKLIPELVVSVGHPEDRPLGFKFGLSVAKLKPRSDTIPHWAINYSGSSGTTILPSPLVWHLYNMYLVYGGFHYFLTISEPLYFYPGLDIVIAGIDIEYDSHNSVISQSASDTHVAGGLRPRIGFHVTLGYHHAIFIEASRSLYRSTLSGFDYHNDVGLGYLFQF